jgi:hypothetical protein
MTKGSSRKSNNFKVKRSEVIWSLHQDRVWKEIGDMLGVEDASTSTPGWFQNRLPAIKRIFESMTAEEKAVLEAEQEKMEREGYPEKTKRMYVNPWLWPFPWPRPLPMMLLMFYSLAEKNLVKCVEETARQQWLEMGVLSVTFTAYTAPDGLMVVDA